MATVGVTKTVIRFKLGQRKLTLDYRKVPFSAWAELKRTVEFTQKTLLNGIAELDVEAIAALIWLERKQRERKLSIVEVLNSMDADGGEDAEEFEILAMTIDGKSIIRESSDDAAESEADGNPTKDS